MDEIEYTSAIEPSDSDDGDGARELLKVLHGSWMDHQLRTLVVAFVGNEEDWVFHVALTVTNERRYFTLLCLFHMDSSRRA